MVSQYLVVNLVCLALGLSRSNSFRQVSKSRSCPKKKRSIYLPVAIFECQLSETDRVRYLVDASVNRIVHVHHGQLLFGMSFIKLF
jgi:hypothetical protein